MLSRCHGEEAGNDKAHNEGETVKKRQLRPLVDPIRLTAGKISQPALRQIKHHPGYPKPRTGVERWAGFVIFASEELLAIALGYGLALVLYTYGIFPVSSCNIIPVYCGSILGVMGAVFSGSFFLLLPGLIRGRKSPRLAIAIIMIILAPLVFVPQPVAHADVVANIFNPADYQPQASWVTPPNNVTVNTVITNEWYVFEWWFYWSFHNPTLPGTAVTNVTYEPVYVYADIAKQTLIALAYRYHYQWYCRVAQNVTGIPCTAGIVAVQCSQCVALPLGFSSPTIPIITFISNYFAPANVYPGNQTQLNKVASLYGILGNFKYLGPYGNYTYTVTPTAPALGIPADPVAILTINAPLYWDITLALIAFHVPWFFFVFVMARRRSGGISGGTLRGRKR